jgi:DNA-binding NarL/FixJ family response regulator
MPLTEVPAANKFWTVVGAPKPPRDAACEREVLVLMVTGLTSPEIAERPVVSRSTAKAHVSNVLSKPGLPNRAEAVALAVQNKLV